MTEITEDVVFSQFMDHIADEGGAIAWGYVDDPNESACRMDTSEIKGVAVLGWGYSRLALWRAIARCSYIRDIKVDDGDRVAISSIEEIRVKVLARGGFVDTDSNSGIPMTLVEVGRCQ